MDIKCLMVLKSEIYALQRSWTSFLFSNFENLNVSIQKMTCLRELLNLYFFTYATYMSYFLHKTNYVMPISRSSS